jgi:hypothetical protein
MNGVAHICTTKSLQAGIDVPPTDCPFCKHKTLYAGWVGMDCSTCRASFCDHSGFTVRSVRDGLKMTRKELAEQAGLRPSTIKRYEWVHPSRKYWEWLKSYSANTYRTYYCSMAT